MCLQHVDAYDVVKQQDAYNGHRANERCAALHPARWSILGRAALVAVAPALASLARRVLARVLARALALVRDGGVCLFVRLFVSFYD